MHLANGTQFFNITPLSISCACLTANGCAAVLAASGFGSGPTFPIIVIVPFTSMHASA